MNREPNKISQKEKSEIFSKKLVIEYFNRAAINLELGDFIPTDKVFSSWSHFPHKSNDFMFVTELLLSAEFESIMWTPSFLDISGKDKIFNIDALELNKKILNGMGKDFLHLFDKALISKNIKKGNRLPSLRMDFPLDVSFHKELKNNLNIFIKGIKEYMNILNNHLELKEKDKLNVHFNLIPYQVIKKQDIEMEQKTNKKLLEQYKKTVHWKFDNIGGYDKVKQQLREVIGVLKNKKKADDLRVKQTKGIIFHGPPGTGKTLFAGALANELDWDLYSIKSSDVFEKWVGSSERNMQIILDNLPKKSILFIDEIESLFRSRDSSHETTQAVLNLILDFLDGIDSKNKSREVLFVGATNMKDILDSASVRSGRIDTNIEIPLPDINSRKKIISYYIKDIDNRYKGRIDYLKLASLTDGMSGADIEDVINKSKQHILLEKKRTKITTKLIISKIEDLTKNNKNHKKIGFGV